ncbi:putative mucin TcMUCII [Trypanosoma cruzi]|uniref:Mucin TcMUCII, putative n=2 Tax=Trypanosoma cruzi TaxID=5693 RepID=Q4E2H1_TRYCC|nr:mucin TcMUCII, putative [Trypanosoma cruzi]EAN98959.1 mucin TcMUCII, putative [Trypanosoma cruzi]KAF8300668.1 putative mucin TcMUCII [Trypanosoma cruzi]PWV09578.1 putative mucin TcMUCII [Trypanosoma cruzi]RNC38541.1 mucin TcMUCII [Trypanosoma cruzi]|eukprot:XP_820810.1 mucin TcMUCII [Trypanosoma cruzi strain CL Brener]
MMMTCRLLCALLVLALCCCPSVCAALDTPEKPPNTTTTTTSQAPDPTKSGLGDDVNTTSLSLSLPGSPSKEPVVERGKTVGGEEGLTGQEAPTVTEDTKEVKNGTTGPRSGNNPPAKQTNEESEASAQTTTTTTTTTHAPSTTTTEAPATTTTTEAPAVSTTRTPSRLREIDGSLVSSAWVCAPLVLAASALAYTAVG